MKTFQFTLRSPDGTKTEFHEFHASSYWEAERMARAIAVRMAWHLVERILEESEK